MLASISTSLRTFRGPLILAIRNKGHDVHCAAPSLSCDTHTKDWLLSHGVICHDIVFSRAGTNPLSDFFAVSRIYRLCSLIKPNIFLGYTAKPIIWGLLGAWLARVPQRVAMITGLGFAFTEGPGIFRRLIRLLSRSLYWFSLHFATTIFFQNCDDRDDFRSLGLIPVATPVHLINGSGIDLNHFPKQPINNKPFRFLLIARLLADKGIREYVSAARIVKKEWPDVEFHLVGGIDSNPSAIPVSEVDSWQRDDDVIVHGHLNDVRPILSLATVYVLPSYREGTPHSVLEAMATGRPIITTSVPGCRETVIDGYNGYLVPAYDPIALSNAMLRFYSMPKKSINAMANNSFALASSRFDVHKVNLAILQAIKL